MTHLLLLAEGATAVEPEADELVVHWEGQAVPAGHISLPSCMGKDLLHIRTEHAAWAWDMARLRVDGQEVQEHLKAGASLSMWWCSLLYERHPKMTPHLYTIYKLRALERLLDAKGVTHLRLAGGDRRLRHTLSRLCSSSGRKLVFLGPEQVSVKGAFVRRLYAACPAPLRAGLRYVHWWWTVRRRLPPCRSLPPASEQQKTATIATYFPNVDMAALKAGRFRSRYWENLHHVLNEQAAREGAAGHFVRWLFIRFPAPQLDFAQCLAARDSFRQTGKDGLSFHYLEEFLQHGDLWAALRRFVRLCLRSWRLQKTVLAACCFAGSHLNFQEYVKDDWAESFRGWRGLERCLQYRACMSYTRIAGPQRWTLFPLENCPWERMLSHAIHETGHGPVLGAQHSTIRSTDFRYFDDPRAFMTSDCLAFQPDAIGGNGASACSQWLAAGLPPQRLIPVEALRYLYLASSDPAPAQRSAADAPSLLVLTSFFKDETEAHLRLLAQTVKAGLLQGWSVTVKPHPYLPVAEHLQQLLGAQAKDITLADGPMSDYLRSGVTVWGSNSTTAALEAVIKGLPAMVMAPTGDFDLCPIQDVPGLVRTASLADVRRALQNLTPLGIADDYLYLDAALPRWRRWLGV